VTAKNDFGIWREKTSGGETDLLLRHGDQAGAHTVEKLKLFTPVSNATDQRRTFAPDGGLAATAQFEAGGSGVVRVLADGSKDVPVDTSSAVPDESGAPVAGIEFQKFNPPATASGGKLALLATLRAVAQGQATPSQAIFSNQSGSMRRVLARGDAVPGTANASFSRLGDPLMGERAFIGLLTTLSGRGVTPATRKAIVAIDGGEKSMAARLGEAAVDYGGAKYRKFISMVVTDSDPARVVFTAMAGGPGINASNNIGLWSYSKANGTRLVFRKGGTIVIGDQTLTVRTFEALQAPRKNMGQGRSTDASGFVTAKATLSDGRTGVLRIPLP
jgi:hypothetical protein